MESPRTRASRSIRLAPDLRPPLPQSIRLEGVFQGSVDHALAVLHSGDELPVVIEVLDVRDCAVGGVALYVRDDLRTAAGETPLVLPVACGGTRQ